MRILLIAANQQAFALTGRASVNQAPSVFINDIGIFLHKSDQWGSRLLKLPQ